MTIDTDRQAFRDYYNDPFLVNQIDAIRIVKNTFDLLSQASHPENVSISFGTRKINLNYVSGEELEVFARFADKVLHQQKGPVDSAQASAIIQDIEKIKEIEKFKANWQRAGLDAQLDKIEQELKDEGPRVVDEINKRISVLKSELVKKIPEAEKKEKEYDQERWREKIGKKVLPAIYFAATVALLVGGTAAMITFGFATLGFGFLGMGALIVGSYLFLTGLVGGVAETGSPFFGLFEPITISHSSYDSDRLRQDKMKLEDFERKSKEPEFVTFARTLNNQKLRQNLLNEYESLNSLFKIYEAQEKYTHALQQIRDHIPGKKPEATWRFVQQQYPKLTSLYQKANQARGNFEPLKPSRESLHEAKADKTVLWMIELYDKESEFDASIQAFTDTQPKDPFQLKEYMKKEMPKLKELFDELNWQRKSLGLPLRQPPQGME